MVPTTGTSPTLPVQKTISGSSSPVGTAQPRRGIIGEATLDISQFRLDFGILGISGIDSTARCWSLIITEARTRRAIIESSPRDAGGGPF